MAARRKCNPASLPDLMPFKCRASPGGRLGCAAHLAPDLQEFGPFWTPDLSCGIGFAVPTVDGRPADPVQLSSHRSPGHLDIRSGTLPAAGPADGMMTGSRAEQDQGYSLAAEALHRDGALRN